MADQEVLFNIPKELEDLNFWLAQTMIQLKEGGNLTEAERTEFAAKNANNITSVLAWPDGRIDSSIKLGNDIFTVTAAPKRDNPSEIEYFIGWESAGRDKVTYKEFTLSTEIDATPELANNFDNLQRKVGDLINKTLTVEHKQLTEQAVEYSKRIKFHEVLPEGTTLDYNRIQITDFSRVTNDFSLVIPTNNPEYCVLVESITATDGGDFLHKKPESASIYLVHKNEITHADTMQALDRLANGDDVIIDFSDELVSVEEATKPDVVLRTARALASNSESLLTSSSAVAKPRHKPQYSGDADTGKFELPTDGGVLNPSFLFPDELQTAKVDVPLGTYTRKISDAPLDLKNLSAFKGTLSELTEQVAKEFNLDPVKFQSVIQLESVFRPEDDKVKRCMGLGQFALTTFEEVITRNKLTEKYPDVVWARTNPVAATIATAYHTVENLEAVAGKKESYTDLDYAHAYIYHNLGATGGKRMIADLKKDSLDGVTIDIEKHTGATTNPKIYKTEDKSRYLKYGELEDHLLKLLADEYELYKNNPSAQQEVDPSKKYKSEIEPDVVSNDAPESKIPAAVLAQARAASPNSPEYKPGPANPTNLPQHQQAQSTGAFLA